VKPIDYINLFIGESDLANSRSWIDELEKKGLPIEGLSDQKLSDMLGKARFKYDDFSCDVNCLSNKLSAKDRKDEGVDKSRKYLCQFNLIAGRSQRVDGLILALKELCEITNGLVRVYWKDENSYLELDQENISKWSKEYLKDVKKNKSIKSSFSNDKNGWIDRINQSLNFLESKGFEIVEPFNALPPITEKQLDEFKKKTNLSLPKDLSDFLTKHTSGFKFYWRADDAFAQFELGGYPDGFLCALTNKKGNPLLNTYNWFQEFPLWWKENEQDSEYEENKKILQHSLPLAMEANGDIIAIRFDTKPSQVILLNHDYSHRFTYPDLIDNRGFSSFMENWAAMHFVSLDPLNYVINPETGLIDSENILAIEWTTYLEGLEV
jgi:hypothetical protein